MTHLSSVGEVLTLARFLRTAAAVGVILSLYFALAQPTAVEALRVGIVVPTQTGATPVNASLFDIVGEAARQGARLFEGEPAPQGELPPIEIKLFFASAPSSDAAIRAAERLVLVEDVAVLIGGLGEGQAAALATVAQEHGVLFFNIGSTSQDLRRPTAHSYTFHVEASALMYLDALVTWFHRMGHERWFVVHDRSARGLSLREHVAQVISRNGAGRISGEAGVDEGQRSYARELQEIADSGADVVLLLLGARDQIAFLAQQEAIAADVAVAPYPHPVTQTRDYLAAVRRHTPEVAAWNRIALWESTLEGGGAGELNQRYASRWGAPMEPSAWATFKALKILQAAARTAGSRNAEDILRVLESRQVTFDVGKGTRVSFDPETHQLRQPLYALTIDADVEWGSTLANRLDLVKLLEELPDPQLGTPDEVKPSDAAGGSAGEER